MRNIVIGDIHGCIEEFDELLKTVQYKQGIDRLILLGDLIDRGPDPAGVVRRAREVGALSVMGNHEEKALRWRRHEARTKIPPGYKNPMKPTHPDRLAQWAAIRDEDWDWLNGLPYYIHVNVVWTAVHAGCMPDVTIEKQDPKHLLRLRYIDQVKNKMASLNYKGECPEGAIHWTNLWTDTVGRAIVYGHYVYDKVERSWNGLAMGIDTGACHGNLLTAAIVEDSNLLELASVKAKRVYAERHWSTDSLD